MNLPTFNRKYKALTSVLLLVIMAPKMVYAFPGAFDIGLAIFTVFAQIAGMAGIVLNMAITELVIEMGDKMRDSFGASVEAGWTVIRDIINICFIFGLVYIGFKVILDDDSHVRKLLPALIVAALLINFSLFFTKAIIDVTNVAAVEIYQAAVGTDIGGNVQAQKTIGVAGLFTEVMGISSLIAPERDAPSTRDQFLGTFKNACPGETKDTVSAKNCTLDVLVYFMIASIFMIVYAYAMLVGAFLIIVRFVMLIMLMITSPLMFIGMALPIGESKSLTKQWWNQFISAALMAPAYFLLLYISLKVASKLGIANATTSMFNAATGDYSAMEGTLNLIIVCAFMIMAVTVAKSMAKKGSSTTLSLADNARKRGQRMMMAGAAGGAAWGLRNTVGSKASDMSQNSERIQLAQGKGLRAWTARQTLRASEKAAGASFDARNSAALKGVVGMAGGNAAQELGTPGGKGGYAQKLKDRGKLEEKRAELFGGNDDMVYTDYGVEAQHKQYKEYEKDRAKAEQEMASLSADPSNAAKRQELLARIQSNSANMKKMEKGELLINVSDEWNKHVENGGTDTRAEFEAKRKAEAEQYKQARTQEKGYGARRYATNREQAWQENRFNKVVGWAFTDGKARRAGAKAVKKKNAAKSNDQKVLDAIKAAQEADGGGSTPAPAPAAGGDAGGGDTGGGSATA